MSENPIQAVDAFVAKRKVKKLSEENAKLLVACKILAMTLAAVIPITTVMLVMQGRALVGNERFLRKNFEAAWAALYYPGLTPEEILDELV